ncbi:MAG TPA: hypothetical protein VHV32_11420 [Candidatus Angelobacter sp.]|nr:hypothetical protein [Candidatus Angelobacter sp.]
MAATSMPAGVYCPRKIKILFAALCVGLICVLSGCAGRIGGALGSGVDFALAVSPGSQTVTAGDLLTYDINIAQKSGLGPLVQLSVSGLPLGSAANFSDSLPSGPGTVRLFILTALNTPAGTFHLTITGSDLSGTQTTDAIMTVNPGPPPIDFIVSVTPATQTTLGGGTVSYQIDVFSDNAAPVNLSVIGLPAGATATFNPAAVTGKGSSTLTIVTQDPTAPGFYGLSVIGTDPTGTQKIPIILNIPSVDFTLQQQVGPSGVTAGGNIISTVTATAVLGTLQSVSLSVVSGLPPGASASFNPAILGGSVTASTMTITTTTSLVPGIYQLAIQGADASGIQTAQVPFIVSSGNPSAGFFLAAVPDELEVNASGGQAASTIIVSNNAGPVPRLTFSLSSSGNVSASLTAIGGNFFQLTVSSADPLSDQSVGDVVITATGPDGTQQIEVSVQIEPF